VPTNQNESLNCIADAKSRDLTTISIIRHFKHHCYVSILKLTPWSVWRSSKMEPTQSSIRKERLGVSDPQHPTGPSDLWPLTHLQNIDRLLILSWYFSAFKFLCRALQSFVSSRLERDWDLVFFQYPPDWVCAEISCIISIIKSLNCYSVTSYNLQLCQIIIHKIVTLQKNVHSIILIGQSLTILLKWF
jgi:hypothetical protein